MNKNTFNKSILNILSIPLLGLSIFSYHKTEFYLFLLFASIVVLINFDNFWYLHWIIAIFFGPILSNIFFNNTIGSMSKGLINNVGFFFLGIVIYWVLVSLIKHYFEYLNRKRIINEFRNSLNQKITLTLENFATKGVDFSLKIHPLSYKTTVDTLSKIDIITDLSNKLNSHLKTVRFKDVLFGGNNEYFLSSLKKYLEIKDLLNNYRISNDNSVMSIFKDIKNIFENNNIILDNLEKVYKSMDYELIARLQESFLSDYNSCVLNPPRAPFIKGLIDHTDFKYIENIQLKIDNNIVSIDDIIIANTGIFIVKEYYEPMNMHNLKVDINGSWVKFFNTGEIDIDKSVSPSVTASAKLFENIIKSKLPEAALNNKFSLVNPIIIVDHKNLTIENQSAIKIIPSSKLEETIRNFQQQLPASIFNSVNSIVPSLVPEQPSYEYEFPSPNMLNLIDLGAFTMKLIDDLHVILLDNTANFIEKYRV